jgi:hypothetical protein
LARWAKDDARRIWIARQMRVETSVILKWIVRELQMGTWAHAANRLQHVKYETESNNQDELALV